MKILIAEDDEALAREIQMACTRWDFTVDTVQDFLKASGCEPLKLKAT